MPQQRAQWGDGAVKVAWMALVARLILYTGPGGGRVRRGEVKGGQNIEAEVKGKRQESRSHTGRLRNELKQSELPVSNTKPNILELD